MATLLIILCMVGAVFGQCYVDRIDVQDNFDIRKFSGKWYEVSWVQYYFEPPYDNYLDYVQNYTVVNSTWVSAVHSGRTKREDQSCNIGHTNYTVSSTNPAKWSSVMRRDGKDYHIDHWIITTDYDNYAFVYGCTNRKQNGQCLNAHAWKWSRSPRMSAEHLRVVNNAVSTVCMNGYSFIESDQLEACELTSDGQITAGGCFVTGSTMLVLLSGFLWRILV